MGKINKKDISELTFTPIQRIIFDEFSKNVKLRIKDFVDLYFLLKEFTFWDLLCGVKEKFRMELDFVWLASDFLKVEKFNYMPKMLVPLNLKDLQGFYKDLAKKLGMRVVKK